MIQREKSVQKIDVFISSPSDVKEEREIVINKVIQRLNKMPQIARRFVLKPLAYEQIVPPAIGEAPPNVIDRYMMEACNADIYICILWHRFGTPVIDDSGGKYQSGTEYEFISAYQSNQEKGKPRMLLYRSRKDIPPEHDLGQLRRVDEFFERFVGEKSDLKGLYYQYKSNEEFEQILFDHLNTIIASDFDQIDAEVPALGLGSYRKDFYQHISLPINYVKREKL